MTMSSPPSPPPVFTPTASSQRLDALDVLRGFALVGICIVNVEYFNRPVVDSGSGMQAGLEGLDWLTAFVVNYFFTGKFWTIFSLLFGMGFALMLERARAAGRPFLPAYLRRIGALAVFGLLHHVFLWSGDILLSYAVGAIVLMLTLFARARILFLALLACMGLSALFDLPFLAHLAMPIGFAAFIGLYLRPRPGHSLFPLALLVPGGLMLLSALIMGATGKTEGVDVVTVVGALLVILALLARRYSEPESARPLRAGIVIFVLSFGLIAAEGGVRYFAPHSGALSAATATSDEDVEASDAESRRLRHRERVRRSAEERKVLTTGSHADAVAMRTRHLGERMRDEMGFGVVLVGVFLIGVWFVRSSVIAHAGAHLPMLRRLALAGIVGGVLAGLASGLIATGRPSGIDDQGYDFAHGLLMLGSLPASLGYLAAVLLMLHSRGPLARVRLLAPFGRMALTNYLVQSLVFASLFYGHGLGLWGMGRAAQVGVALALCALQVAFSHWWLACFRYGPVEWVWRALTYLKRP